MIKTTPEFDADILNFEELVASLDSTPEELNKIYCNTYSKIYKIFCSGLSEEVPINYVEKYLSLVEIDKLQKILLESDFMYPLESIVKLTFKINKILRNHTKVIGCLVQNNEVGKHAHLLIVFLSTNINNKSFSILIKENKGIFYYELYGTDSNNRRYRWEF